MNLLHTFRGDVVWSFFSHIWSHANEKKIVTYQKCKIWGQIANANSAYFGSTGSGSWDIGLFSKLPWNLKLGHETWPLAKVPNVAHILSCYLRGWKCAYFRSMGSGFRNTGRFSKLPYLGMKLGIGQRSRTCTYTPYTPPESQISLHLALWLAISKMGIFFHWPQC